MPNQLEELAAYHTREFERGPSKVHARAEAATSRAEMVRRYTAATDPQMKATMLAALQSMLTRAELAKATADSHRASAAEMIRATPTLAKLGRQ